MKIYWWYFHFINISHIYLSINIVQTWSAYLIQLCLLACLSIKFLSETANQSFVNSKSSHQFIVNHFFVIFFQLSTLEFSHFVFHYDYIIWTQGHVNRLDLSIFWRTFYDFYTFVYLRSTNKSVFRQLFYKTQIIVPLCLNAFLIALWKNFYKDSL